MRVSVVFVAIASMVGCRRSTVDGIEASQSPGPSPRALEPSVTLQVEAEPPRVGQPIALEGNSSMICAERFGADIACFGDLSLFDPSRGVPGGYSEEKTAPVALTGFRNVRVSAGDYDRCLLDGAGAVKCWGLGHSLATFPIAVPWPRSDLSRVRDVDTDGTTCVVTESGTVSCWERPPCTPYGRDDSVNRWIRSRPIEGIDDAVGVAASPHMQCALLRDGTVTCWGSRGFERECTKEARWSLPEVDDAVQVELGIQAGCVRTRAGAVRCWGYNRFNLLGTPDEDRRASTPIAIEGLTSVVELSMEEDNACALRADGEVWCWGGGFGVARPVAGAGEMIDVVAGNDFACTLSRSHRVHCFGRRIERAIAAGHPPPAFETDEAWIGAPQLWPGLDQDEVALRGAVDGFQDEAELLLRDFVWALETRCEGRDCAKRWPTGAGPTLADVELVLDEVEEWRVFLEGVRTRSVNEGFEVEARPTRDGEQFVLQVRYGGPIFDRPAVIERRCDIRDIVSNGVRSRGASCDFKSTVVQRPRSVSYSLDTAPTGARPAAHPKK